MICIKSQAQFFSLYSFVETCSRKERRKIVVYFTSNTTGFCGVIKNQTKIFKLKSGTLIINLKQKLYILCERSISSNSLFPNLWYLQILFKVQTLVLVMLSAEDLQFEIYVLSKKIHKIPEKKTQSRDWRFAHVYR